MAVEIRLLPCLADNYAVLVHDPASGATAVVDVPDAAVVAAELDRAGWRLSDILVTHHHADHTQGIPALKARTGARVTGPRAEAGTIPGLDVQVGAGDRVAVGGLAFDVLETPGHTKGHIAFHAPDAALAFVGDTLFVLGCGRVIEGTTDEMWASLQKLRALPGETRVYCGHEYTLSNARFALTVDPNNGALRERASAVERLRAAGRPTLPTTIAQERATNPFLRADDPAIAAAVGLAGADPAAVFAEVRARKNRS